MIEQLRRASESWVAKGLFLFMAIAFVVMWGGGDLAHQIGGHNQTVVTVGSRKITSSEFADTFNHYMREIQARLGELIDAKKAHELGLYDVVRTRLIQESLLDQEAERLKVYVSDNFIRDHIRGEKIFQIDGKFHHERFKMLIAKIGYDEKTYIEFLRRELTRERLIDALTSGITIPKAMILPLYIWQNEQRQVNTVTIDSQKIIVREKPSLEMLQAFFNEHVNEFNAPEYRSFSMLMFSTDDIAKKIDVSSEEIDTEYQTQHQDYPNKKLIDIKPQLISSIKNRRLAHEIQNLITNIEDAIGAGHSLSEIADKYGLKLQTTYAIDQGGIVDPFYVKLSSDNAQNSLPEKIAPSILKNVFTNELGAIGSIVDAGQGQYFITEVSAIAPASARTFDQVKSKIADYWLRFEQIKRAQDQAKTIVNAIKGGGSFDTVVTKNNLSSVTARISRLGMIGPSVTKINDKGLGIFYQVQKGDPVSFLNDQDDKGVKFVVGIVKAIERSKDKVILKDMEKITASLKQSYINNIVNQYLKSLHNKYPVELNEQYFKNIGRN